ncbi:MAG: hypothetical protein U0746_02810 [Gemmataceae bacterium]
MNRLLSIIGLVAMIALPLRFAFLHGKQWEFRGGLIRSTHRTLPGGKMVWADGSPVDPISQDLIRSGMDVVICNGTVLVLVTCGCWVFHMDRNTRKLRREVQAEMDRIWPHLAKPKNGGWLGRGVDAGKGERP